MAQGVGQLPTSPPLPGTTAVQYINVVFALLFLDFVLKFTTCGAVDIYALDGPM
jgi:hypothetical protein